MTLTSLTVPNSRHGQHSPCGGGRSLSPWATPLSMVTVGIVESLFVLTLACQSSCVLTRISRFRLWASFLRIWLRSFSFTNSDSNDIWRFFFARKEPRLFYLHGLRMPCLVSFSFPYPSPSPAPEKSRACSSMMASACNVRYHTVPPISLPLLALPPKRAALG